MIELLVVIAIIGVLASVILVALNQARVKARDAQRLSDMHQIQNALELYFHENGQYPGNTDNDFGGWDVGFNGGQGSGDVFIQPLETGGFISKTPGDPITTNINKGYRYYRYPAGHSGCSTSRGAFYVLAVVDMETSGFPHPTNPGWSCPLQDWTNATGADWVTGKFEN